LSSDSQRDYQATSVQRQERLQMNRWQTIGLAVFVTVVVLNVAGLMLDVSLYAAGRPTITATARKYAWLASVILIVEQAGVCGLAMHFHPSKE
jgi:hypothetical protein